MFLLDVTSYGAARRKIHYDEHKARYESQRISDYFRRGPMAELIFFSLRLIGIFV